MNIQVEIKDIKVANNNSFVLISGPCQIESLDHTRYMCENLKNITNELNIGLIFKASYDKANRSSHKSKRGVGIDKGLEILSKIREEFDVPVLTDVHETEQVKKVSQVVDVIQIPAFLCRQTDLLIESAKTGKPIHVKKGQFLSPYEMKGVIEKIKSTGNEKILLCERGTFFGYQSLVNDFTGIEIMKSYGYPVIFDATHSVQKPGALGDSSGGNRQFVIPLAKAAISLGIAGLFMETHQDPDNSPSDGPNMIKLSDMKKYLRFLKYLDYFIKEYRYE
jgi:2-dehydro-3-deoxyphosphooctonate aldolase (KDO 8-P synthase)